MLIVLPFLAPSSPRSSYALGLLQTCVVLMILLIAITARPAVTEGGDVGSEANRSFTLTPDHIAAVNRKRRIVVNHQVDGMLKAVNKGLTIDEIMEYEFAFTDEPGSHIDAQWWSLDNTFPMKARILIDETSPSVPSYVSRERVKIFQQWADEGVNLAKIYAKETKKRGLECFYSFRLNEGTSSEHLGLAEAHPDWVIHGEWDQPIWNFAVPEVRQFKTNILRELAEEFDYDGLEIDFARGVILTPAGHQWEHREHITEFLRMVRQATLEAERKRGQAVLLAARVPDNLIGCHFDGLDIETWVRENLIDMLVLGVRTYDLDVAALDQLIGPKSIKILAALDDHHCTDGYSWPPIEVWRGVCANWWQQGVDAIQTFNWGVAPPEVAAKFSLRFMGAYQEGGRQIPVYQQAYHELGDPGTLKFLNKHFVVQRRGGGGSGGAEVNAWRTPRFNYQNTNMLGQLPAPLDNAGRVDTLLRLRVADDLNAVRDRITSLTVRVLLSDPAIENLSADQKVDSVTINSFWDRGGQKTSPARKDVADRLELRVNNMLLERSTVENGWFQFTPDPAVFAVGENLVGILVQGRDLQSRAMTVEKLEVHVSYQ